MDMGTIGAIATLLLAVSSSALAAQNKKENKDKK